MKHILLATAVALGTLAGTTTAFAQVTCRDLLTAAMERDLVPEGGFTLMDPDETIVCQFDAEGTQVGLDNFDEEDRGLFQALQNASPRAANGLLTALDATGTLDGERGVDGRSQGQANRSDRAGQGGQGGQGAADRPARD